MSISVRAVSEPRMFVREYTTRRRVRWFVIGAGALVLAVIASLALGSRLVSISEVVSGVAGATNTLGEAAVALRVPRTVLAVVVGAMLAMAGASFQAITRNPMADPGILGVSFGASLAVVIGIAVFAMSSPAMFVLAAIVGAGLAAALVYVIGSLGVGGLNPLKLTLAGAACAAAFSSIISAVLLPRVDILSTFRHWQVGGVGGATWDRVALVAPFAIVGASICVLLARRMNLLALGDDVAAGLGAHVTRTRLFGWVGAVVLTGAATAMVGPIAFVGLVVAHACRLALGPDYRWILPLTALLGAVLLVTADVVGRVVARPEEIEVGIVTAIVGAPVFVWIVRRGKVRGL